MPPVTTLSVTLKCPFASGKSRQRATVDFLDFDEAHAPVGVPNITVATNSQPSIVEVIKISDLVFKVRTKAPRPPGVTSAIVVFDDNRLKTDGSPVPNVQLNITLQDQPDQSSFESDESTPLVAEDEPDNAP